MSNKSHKHVRNRHTCLYGPHSNKVCMIWMLEAHQAVYMSSLILLCFKCPHMDYGSTLIVQHLLLSLATSHLKSNNQFNKISMHQLITMPNLLNNMLHHILSLIAYKFRENREFVFIIIVQLMMSADSWIRFALQIVLRLFVQYTISLSPLCKLIWRHWTHKMPVIYILSSVWVRLSIFSQSSIIQSIIDLRTAQVYWDAIFWVSQEVSKFPPFLWVKLWVGWVGRGYIEISRYFPVLWINRVTLVTKIKLWYSLGY